MSPPLVPASKSLLGQTLAGRYQVLQTLSAGGMGVIYVARHLWTRREVALKVVRPHLLAEDSIIGRFLREAQSAAQLEHPNVVDVLDMGRTDDGLVFMVLEMLEGETLEKRMSRGKMSVAETVELLEPIMDALVYIHERQMIHRDIKPSNIFLAEATRRGVVPKLLDFGLVKLLDEVNGGTGTHAMPVPLSGSYDASVTHTGYVLGTPLYSAPEQVRGERSIGPAADVWSMAIVLYEALTGEKAYQTSDPLVAINAIASRSPRPIEQLDPSLPPELCAWIDRALSQDPGVRPAMAELRDGLLQAARVVEASAETELPSAGTDAGPVASETSFAAPPGADGPTVVDERPPPIDPFAALEGPTVLAKRRPSAGAAPPHEAPTVVAKRRPASSPHRDDAEMLGDDTTTLVRNPPTESGFAGKLRRAALPTMVVAAVVGTVGAFELTFGAATPESSATEAAPAVRPPASQAARPSEMAVPEEEPRAPVAAGPAAIRATDAEQPAGPAAVAPPTAEANDDVADDVREEERDRERVRRRLAERPDRGSRTPSPNASNPLEFGL